MHAGGLHHRFPVHETFTVMCSSLLLYLDLLSCQQLRSLTDSHSCAFCCFATSRLCNRLMCSNSRRLLACGPLGVAYLTHIFQ